jgi:hypothetical protein
MPHVETEDCIRRKYICATARPVDCSMTPPSDGRPNELRDYFSEKLSGDDV